MKRSIWIGLPLIAVFVLVASAQAERPFGMRGGKPGLHFTGGPRPGGGFGGPGGHMRGGFGGGPGMGHGPGRMLPILLKHADLTPEQRGKVNEIMESHRPAFRRLFDQLHEAHEALGDRMFSKTEISDGDLDADINRVMDLRGQLMREGTEVMLEVRRILTAEQLEKVASTRKRLDEWRSEMRDLFGDPRKEGF